MRCLLEKFSTVEEWHNFETVRLNSNKNIKKYLPYRLGIFCKMEMDLKTSNRSVNIQKN